MFHQGFVLPPNVCALFMKLCCCTKCIWMKKHMKILIDLILFDLWGFQQYITVLSWRSVLLAEYREKTIDLSQVTDKLYHILYRVHLAWAMFEITTLVVIGIGCIANYKSNYHTITSTTAPKKHYYTPLISNIHLWKQTFALFLQSLNFKLGNVHTNWFGNINPRVQYTNFNHWLHR
jgi:hypothetical protein